MRLPLKALKTEPDDFQFREFEVTEDHVRSLEDALKSGAELDPLTVWKRDDDDFVVVDGHHRHAAYCASGHTKPVPVVVHECSERDAMLLALRENSKTKLPMTKTERTNAAWRLVCSDHELSKAETVSATGVSDGTVAKMRKTRRRLDEQDTPLPETWWEAMRVLKGTERPEWDDDMKEQMIEARARQLDDAAGKEIGYMAERQWEALAIVLERRLSSQVLGYVLDELRFRNEEDDFETPF